MSTPDRRLDARLPRRWDTAAAGLWVCARALGDDRPVDEIAAASGLAWRISTDRRATLVGPHAYPWREVLAVAAARLGYRARIIAAELGEPLFDHACDEAFAAARDGVAEGRPTLLFGVHAAEFGVVRGFDAADDALVVSGVLDDGPAPDRLPRSRLGGEAGLLFALQLVERVAIDPLVAAAAALRAAIAHLRGGDPTIGGFATGAAAWQRLATAVAGGDLDPAGLAYSAQRFAEARAAVATYLPIAQATLRIDLGAAIPAARRSATMLAELARLLPFPPLPGAMLTTTLREQAFELVGEATRAEEEEADAIEQALAHEEQLAAARALVTRDLDPARLPELFACVAEIPIAGLAADAAACRDRLAPSLGERFHGTLLYQAGQAGQAGASSERPVERLVGHILWAPLADAGYPVQAEGARWFIFCPWLDRALRGRGLGSRLFGPLEVRARAAGIDGLLTFATSIEVFLHHRGYEAFGFVEVDRRGDTRLLERRLSSRPSQARIVDAPPPPHGGPLRLQVRHSYNCPLLLRVRRDAAAAGRTLGAAIEVDEADADRDAPSGITVAGQALAHAPIPHAALLAGLRGALRERG